MRHVAGRRPGPLVHDPGESDGRVDDVADEEVHEAAAGGGPAEEDLRLGDGAGVVVQAHGPSAEAAGEFGGERPAAPAEGVVPDHHPFGRVHPAADRGADPEQGRLRTCSSRKPRSAGEFPGQGVRRDALVRVGVAGQDPAAQVDEGEGRTGHAEVDAADDGSSGGADVQVDGDLGPPHSPPRRVRAARAGGRAG